MAVRSSMEYIITFVRELVNDSGVTTEWTDQQIQDRLDLGRLDLYNECLKPSDLVMPDGTIEWHDWWAKHNIWETDFRIQKLDGTSVTATTPEPLIGKFYFEDNQIEPLMISGKVYNVYGTASKILTMMAATLRSQVMSWTADGTTITRIGQIQNTQKLARDYAVHAWGWGNANQIKLVRRDLRN